MKASSQRGAVALRAVLSLLMVVSAVATTVGVTAAPSAAAPVAFTCSTPTAFMSENVPLSNSLTQLYSSAYGSGSITFSPLGPKGPLSYNAIGYNPNDNFLYGIRIGTTDLVQIDSTGAAIDLGAISGLGSPGAGAYYVGAFDSTAPGANYWVTQGIGSSKNVYQVDVTTLTANKSFTLSQFYQPADFTAAAGFMWGLETNSSTIDRLDLSTGAVSTFTVPGLTPNSYWGAAWTLGNGNLSFASNGNGNVYEIAVANPASANPTFSIVSQYSGRTTQANDGASCVGQPVDMSIAKTASPTGTVSPSGTITWTLTVTNNGPGNSSGFAVNDPIPSGITGAATSTPGCSVSGGVLQCAEGALANGGTFTITLAGKAPSTNGTCVTNTASVTGNELDPNSGNNSSSVQTCTTPAIKVVKSANITSFNAVGTVVTYSYLVTNSSTTQTLTSVSVTDPMPGLSAINCPVTTLAPGASTTCTATYTTKQADLDNGSINNTGTASGTSPSGPVSAQSSLTIPAVQSPAIALAKTSNPTTFSAPGTVITYSYKVTNTGNVTLSAVGVTDPHAGLSAINCGGVTTLAPGASTTCTATYTTTQADVDNGSISNTGTATGTSPKGVVVTAPSTVVIPGTRTPKISIVKTANINGFSAPGTAVTYSYLVTNTGNVTLTSVGVTDPLPGLSAVTCPSSTLAPNASETCTATYTTTQADVDKGSVTNTGTASGTGPNGTTVKATSTVTIPATATPSISLVKSASTLRFATPGTSITYNYRVRNTGNVTLHAVDVTDLLPGLSAVSCPTSTLGPGEAETCTATYTTTQVDVDRGSVTNTATASGTPPTGSPVTATDTVTVPLSQSPSIGLEKTARIPDFSAAGTLVTYSYKVTNTGNVTLNPVVVTDPMPGLSAINCPVATLAPAASTTCTATYTTTQADVDRGSVTNTGTATGTPPTGPPVSQTSSVTIPAVSNPGISLVKTPSITSFSAVGTVVTYSYLVKNTGNVTLNPVVVTDPMPGLSTINCPVTTLAPAASTTCTATYTTTQADLDRGSIANTGTAVGKPPTGLPVAAQSSANISANQLPAITLTKTPNPTSFSAPGAVITYSYVVTNTGNVTLNPVGVTDPMSGLSAINCPVATLAPNASTTCTATYTTTQADVDRGSIANTGTATGKPPTGPPVTASSSATVTATQSPAIAVVKSASVPSFTAAGKSITYSYLVTNTGNVTLTSVKVADPLPGLSTVNCPRQTLAPGASTTCTATYTTTQADVDRGSVTNIGTASGTVASSGQTVTAASTVTVPAIQGPAISLVKSADTGTFAVDGTVITYRYVVTNTGNVTLTSIGVTDPLPGLSAIDCGGVTTLAPGGSVTCTASYTTTQADVDAGSVTNTATATGTPPTGSPVTATSTVVITAIPDASIGILKSANLSSFSQAGTTITYSYRVTNTGNVTLESVGVSDPLPGLSAVICPSTTLAVGAVETCTATYTVTQADMDRGSVTNIGTASGTVAATGHTVTAASTVTVPGNQQPAIGLTKTASPMSFGTPGAVITYHYLVSNTGNVSLSPISLTDPLPGLSSIDCQGVTSLAPGGSVTCVATYTTTQDDVDAGGVTNTATVTGTSPNGSVVQAQSSVTVPATHAPAISVVKSASIDRFSLPGVPVTYSYLVTNTGNLTLHLVSVLDPMPGLSPVDCPSRTLAPGESETCTATYTTTQADVDAGGITNTAAAIGVPPLGRPVTDTDTLHIPDDQFPAITVVKTATVASFSAPDEQVGYEYEVTNTGNVTLQSVNVTDPMPGLSAITCPQPTLAPQATEICTATYTTTQADVDRGSITNVGTAHGTPPTGPPVSNTSQATVPADVFPSIGLTKTASTPSFTAPGTPITYTYVVTNTGNVTLHGISVADLLSGLSAVNCNGVTTLAPGDSTTCTATYTTTQADVDRGAVINRATVTGTSPQGVNVTDQATAVVTAGRTPGISLVKTADTDSFSAADTAIVYSYLVTNTGNVTLHNLSVTDPLPGVSAVDCNGVTTLAPGASTTCTATYTTTQADVNAGGITNTGTASGTPPTGSPVTATGTVTVPAVQTPGIGLKKTANISSFSQPGVVITYSYLVTNTGNVTLTNVQVTDPMPGLSPVT
jgi:uncharacterized repeat protein (TIGR01451 family)